MNHNDETIHIISELWELPGNCPGKGKFHLFAWHQCDFTMHSFLFDRPNGEDKRQFAWQMKNQHYLISSVFCNQKKCAIDSPLFKIF